MSPRSIHLYTHKKRKMGKNSYILLSKSTSLIWDDSLSSQVLNSCRYISCLQSFDPLLLRQLREISLSLLCLYSSRGSALDLDPLLRVGRLRASVLRSHRTGLKEQLLRGFWLTHAGGREGYGCGVSLWRRRPA